MNDDPSQWVTSRQLADFLLKHRDNDVKVHIEGADVPIARMEYDREADTIRLHLHEGLDLEIARDVIKERWDPGTSTMRPAPPFD
jgi:hypothetical protein